VLRCQIMCAVCSNRCTALFGYDACHFLEVHVSVQHLLKPLAHTSDARYQRLTERLATAAVGRGLFSVCALLRLSQNRRAALAAKEHRRQQLSNSDRWRPFTCLPPLPDIFVDFRMGVLSTRMAIRHLRDPTPYVRRLLRTY
jgi:hypothetical protein